MLVVAGTLAFTISFINSEDKTRAQANEGARSHLTNDHRPSMRVERSRERSLRARATRSDDAARYDLGLTDDSISRLSDQHLAQANAIIFGTRSHARQKLESLTEKYNLSDDQRRQIFPLIVAHSNQAHPAMLVNGNSLPYVAPGSTLDESIYSLLDSDQQSALAEAAVDDDAWWKDVVGQLEDDLDEAIDNGEMIAVTDDTAGTGGISFSDSAAAGDGEASSHSGGNLFELLGQ